MALQASTKRAEVRRTEDFHPSVWGDYFINKVCRDEVLLSAWTEKAEVLKEEVRKMLTTTTSDKPSQKLHLIDVCLRLGIGYHFEAEINEALEQVYNTNHDYKIDDDDQDLFTVALRFRLLRQHGYSVSSDIFNNFKDGGRGKFKENLIIDAKGLLSLYEASFLSLHGEDILDEALKFCKIHLESIVIQLAPPLAEQVSHALKRPLHKGVEKHEQWYYISSYQKDEAHVEAVLMLAKLDFNILQKLYQDELKVISEWWIDLDFATKLPFARDRLIECYFLALGVFTEPQFVLARRFLTKILILVSTMDDMYDAHGTIEELELFTKTIERLINPELYVASSVECYMKQYGVGKEEAHEKLNKMVESDWKDINEELLIKPTAVPKQVLTVYLNMARVVDVFYKDFDGYTNADTMTKDMLSALLVIPLPI